MRWVLITHLGAPVEPEVKRIFAILSGVAAVTPAAGRAALRHEAALRRRSGPMMEPLGELVWVGRERMRRADIDRAVAAVVEDHLARPEPDRAHRRRSKIGSNLCERYRH